MHEAGDLDYAHDDFVCILYCPTCCTTVDSEGVGWQDFACTSCESEFRVFIDPAIVRAHSMH